MKYFNDGEREAPFTENPRQGYRILVDAGEKFGESGSTAHGAVRV